MPIKIPKLVGHRGWPARYPENTLEGFTAAAGVGAGWLECDVQLSSDRVPFVVHDESLTRTAGISRNVTEMSAAELAKVTVGERRRFGVRYDDTRLPTLAALTAWLITRPQVHLFVEIKRQSLRHFGRDNVVREVLSACQGAVKQCTIISFDHVCLSLVRVQGAMAIGWATEETSPDASHVVDALNPDYVFTSDEMFADVHKALKGSFQWSVYETQDPRRALQLAAQGANFVETNDIGAMLKAPGFALP
ncbi:MAG: glycerophosphodiester phosphodiesterase family protein [Gammaproteobacteria bacterium]